MTVSLALIKQKSKVTELLLTNFDPGEHKSYCLAAWSQEAFQHRLEEFLGTATADGESLHARRDFPDMCECDAGEFTTPTERHGQSAQNG